MATAKALFGGLLAGAGKGMVEQDSIRRQEAERLRQEALERVRTKEDRDFQLQRDADQRAFTLEREQSDREYESGLLSQIDTDAEGNRIAVTKTGETRGLGYRAPADRSSTSGSMTDNQQWSAIVQKNTSKDSNGNDVTDWEAVARDAAETGNPTLVKIAGTAETMPPKGVDFGSDAYLRAAKQAEEEADERDPVGPNFMRGDATSKAYDGKTRAEWINNKTMELYQQYSGRGSRPASPAPGQQGQDATGNKGTEADPYKPTTQEEFDSIPSGMIYLNPADGRRYRKN